MLESFLSPSLSIYIYTYCGSVSKESACNEGDSGLIPASGRSPGEGNGNLLSILAWRIPWTEEPDGLQSMGHRKSDTAE